MKAVFYTRRSKKRDKDQINSHDIQEQAIRSYAERNGIELVGQFADSQTGTNNDRVGWKQMIETLNGIESLSVIFYKVDRIARNLAVFADIERLADGGRVYVVENGSKPIDSTTLGLFMVMAKRESELISARTRASYQLLKARADKDGSKLKWGNPNPRKLAKKGCSGNSSKAYQFWYPILESIYTDYYKNYGGLFVFEGKPRKIQKKDLLEMLDKQGIRTRRGNKITYQALISAEDSFKDVNGCSPMDYFN
jgi:DNA invertase Pin-like site-specific DNA recombinase